MEMSMKQGRYAMSAFLNSREVWNQELPHHTCHCQHCVNSTKPLSKPMASRFTNPREQKMGDSQSFVFLLKRLAKHNYSGRMRVPDVFLIDEATLIHSSQSGRVKVKDSQTNMDIKKHFDDQRRQPTMTTTLTGFIDSLTLSGEEESLLALRSKQIALMTYKDGTSQILSEALTNKIFEKRKNDPFWDEIAYITLLPPEAPQPIQKAVHHYQRTEDTLAQLTPLLEQLGQEMDRQDEKAFVSREGVSQQGRDEELLEWNPEVLHQSSLRLRKRDSVLGSYGRRFMGDPEKEARHATLQLLAFIQLCCQIRILSGVFEFIIERRCVFLGVKDMIWYKLEGLQITLTHQRYHPMEEIGLESIATMKDQLDNIEKEELSKICIGVVNECLERRRAQLRLYDYVKPSKDTMFKIFMKIFPDYKADTLFSSPNWKNKLPAFVQEHKARIHSIIREDEGIRILRRFGIHFRRTFK